MITQLIDLLNFNEIVSMSTISGIYTASQNLSIFFSVGILGIVIVLICSLFLRLNGDVKSNNLTLIMALIFFLTLATSGFLGVKMINESLTLKIKEWADQNYSLQVRRDKLFLFKIESCNYQVSKEIVLPSGISKRSLIEEIGDCSKEVAIIDCKTQPLENCLIKIKENMNVIVKNGDSTTVVSME